MMKAIKAFLAIVKRELRAVSRERTIVIAILIQLFIASFSSAILIGLLSFYDPDAVMAAEEARLLTRLPPGGEVVALTRDGKAMGSRELADYLQDRALRSVPDVTFLIGGAFGLGRKIRDPYAVEGARREMNGLGLLDMETRFLRRKMTFQVEAEDMMGDPPGRFSERVWRRSWPNAFCKLPAKAISVWLWC